MTGMGKNDYIYELQVRCEDAAGGYLDEDEKQALLDEVEGAFGSIPVIDTAVRKAVRSKNFSALRGVVSNFYESGAPEVHTDVNVRVDATMNQTISQMWALPDDDFMPDVKQELTKMLQELDSAKSQGDTSRVQQIGKTICNTLFESAVKAIPTVMPYVTQAIQSAFGA